MITIIFVDDEKNLLDSLKRTLRPHSKEWNMRFLESGDEALKYISGNSCDIVVSDYKMPGMDGLELLSKIKEKYPQIKRILLTGQSDTEIFNRAKDIVDKYVSKPCRQEELIAALKGT